MTDLAPASRTPLWSPAPERVAATNLARFVQAARTAGYDPPDGAAAVDYPSLWTWSVEHPEQFWPVVWTFC